MATASKPPLRWFEVLGMALGGVLCALLVWLYCWAHALLAD